MKVVSRIVDAKNNSEQLGRVLELPPDIVDGIIKMYSNPGDQLFHMIDEFVKHHKKPTWRVIANALRSRLIGLPGLASDIETGKFYARETTVSVRCAMHFISYKERASRQMPSLECVESRA